MPCCQYHFYHHAAQLVLLLFHISPQSDSVSDSSSGDDAQQHQAVFDQPINSVGLDGATLQDYGFGSDLQPHHSELISIQNEISEVHSELVQVASDDASSEQDVMEATSKAMSLVKGYIDDLQLSKSMPSHLQPILKSTSNQITKAEKHMKEVEGFVSRFSLDGRDETDLEKASKVPSHHRKLSSKNQDSSNQGGSSTKYHFNSGVSKADYHHRAKSRHLGQGQGFHPFLGSQFGHHAGHQQGYRNARVTREGGQTTHRRLLGNTNVCLPASRDDRKAEQCLRLAICAAEYSLYDMFAFFFADDFDFDTGGVGDDKIEVNDEVEIKEKVRRLRYL